MISVFAFVKFRNGSWQYKMESQTIRQILSVFKQMEHS